MHILSKSGVMMSDAYNPRTSQPPTIAGVLVSCCNGNPGIFREGTTSFRALGTIMIKVDRLFLKWGFFTYFDLRFQESGRKQKVFVSLARRLGAHYHSAH